MLFEKKLKLDFYSLQTYCSPWSRQSWHNYLRDNEIIWTVIIILWKKKKYSTIQNRRVHDKDWKNINYDVFRNILLSYKHLKTVVTFLFNIRGFSWVYPRIFMDSMQKRDVFAWSCWELILWSTTQVDFEFSIIKDINISVFVLSHVSEVVYIPVSCTIV